MVSPSGIERVTWRLESQVYKNHAKLLFGTNAMTLHAIWYLRHRMHMRYPMQSIAYRYRYVRRWRMRHRYFAAIVVVHSDSFRPARDAATPLAKRGTARREVEKPGCGPQLCVLRSRLAGSGAHRCARRPMRQQLRQLRQLRRPMRQGIVRPLPRPLLFLESAQLQDDRPCLRRMLYNVALRLRRMALCPWRKAVTPAG